MYLKNKKTEQGFTLVEILVYIALLVLIIGAGMTSAYYLITSSEKDSVAFNATAEAEFLLRKIDWALTGSNVIYVPVPNGSESKLSVNKPGFPNPPLEIDTDSGRARIKIDTSSSWIYLTGDRVEISALTFTRTDSVGSLTKIVVTFKANDVPYELTKYLRY